MQQERSVGGTSSLHGYQSSCPRRDGEKKYNMCALLMKLVNH